MSEETLVEASGLTRTYTVRTRSGRRQLTALDAVDLRVTAGSTTALVGESGCGKSTTGRLLLALERPTAGSVCFAGTDLATLSRSQLRAARREFQAVFQDPYDSLNGRMRVSSILAEPAQVHKVTPKRDVRELLDLVDLSAEFADRFPHELSGGQRQRVAIARAIALDPRFVVCDEAVSALDVSVQAQVVNVLRELQRDLGLTYLFISHDLALVRYMADRTVVMYLGSVVEEGETEQLFSDARHPYTQLLLAASPRRRPFGGRERRVLELAGEPPSPLDRPTGCVFSTRCPLATDRCRTERPRLRSVAGRQVACHYAETADVTAR